MKVTSVSYVTRYSDASPLVEAMGRTLVLPPEHAAISSLSPPAGVSVSPHSRILSPHSILGLRSSIFPLSSRLLSHLSSLHAKGSGLSTAQRMCRLEQYLSSLQQGWGITSTATSSAEPLGPRGHPESPPPGGVQCLPSILDSSARHPSVPPASLLI